MAENVSEGAAPDDAGRVALNGHGFKACPEPVEGCHKDRKISLDLALEGMLLPLYHQEKCPNTTVVDRKVRREQGVLTP
jgi:hypothetical protein